MSSKLVPCPYCIANVRNDKLHTHISKVHYKQTRAYAPYRDTGYYTPQRPWSCEREYYREYDSYRDYDAYNWSDADYYYYPTSPRSLRDTHSHRSSATRLSGDHMQEIHQEKKTKNKVYSSSRPSSSGGISSIHASINAIPRKEDKLVSNPSKLQTNKDSAKSNPVKPLKQAMTTCRPVADKAKPKTESKESTKTLPSKYISKSSKEGQPSTNTSNEPKLETSNTLSKIRSEKQQNNCITCSPIPVTAVIKSKHPSRPNTPNTAINSSDIVKKDLKTFGISAPKVNGEESNSNIISNGTDKIDMSTDEVNLIDSHKVPELEEDINFQFINTDGLIGYSLNIR